MLICKGSVCIHNFMILSMFSIVLSPQKYNVILSRQNLVSSEFIKQITLKVINISQNDI